MFLIILLNFPMFTQSKNKEILQASESTNQQDKLEEKSKSKSINSTAKDNEKSQPVMNNANTSKETKTVKDNSSNTANILLVNKNNKLTQNYIPENLKVPNVKFISYADPSVKKMEVDAAYALEQLFKAALKDGINLLAVSGYRTYSYQEKLYNNKVSASGKAEADKYVARPGASEHQTGLAMDVLSTEYSSLDEGFAKTNAYKWLKENCFKYGFIIRYPKEKESITKYSFEPWHIRYVGITASKEIGEKNLTLEEYLNNKV